MGEFRETGGGDEGVEYNIKITKKPPHAFT